MKLLIFEDEPLAQERIIQIIKSKRKDWDVLGTAQSVSEAINLLQQFPDVDLLICDIHLADGDCFKVFEQEDFQIPIIFLTAYDQHALESFNHYCIDYVLKPLQESRLLQAFEKYEQLCLNEQNAEVNPLMVQAVLDKLSQNGYKKRFLTKAGSKMLFKDINEIAYFYAEDKIVFLKEIGTSKKYIINFSLDELEKKMLNPSQFYRINRSIIINVEALIEMKTYHNGRLKLFVKSSDDLDLIVARERVGQFKDWINQ
ncbi:two component transcriptional regulator, LytTR family [Marivirga sericea]|uniref:Two component transcriptional regulator, LytTR family n=1 Tax=Marivirga sericea TaxID=1028 RepID=A0A1X7KC35_9BACT|nr:LytTR family DNA-binding domain-containing protein [Marivirga sericea]SMG38081.1 two component transcriptional regulator, LytTR family [Marivirga sericea]